ncbi:MAG: damage-inducible protein DinB [Acidobacteria bacterium]|nr:damage-inducible protein DinB [Acidobacteriota bacterium]
MPEAPEQNLLEAILDSWDRNNTILVNLVRAVPPGGLEARPTPTSHTVAELLTHLHHERMVSLLEEAPECAGPVPEEEWIHEPDPGRIAQMLTASAQRVRDAVRGRVESGRALDLNYDHPILLLQLLIFHESYHHGQIKLALKLAGHPISDDDAGPLTWDIWRERKSAQ